MADVDSSTGGYLSPADTPAPAEDTDLEAIVQQAVAAITGLDGSLVRPRWQPVMPKQPDADMNWCAIAVMSITPDDGPAITHDGAGEGSDRNVRHEELELLASFYGPGASGLCNRLRDGLGIPQNVEALRAQGIAYVGCGRARRVPDFVNQAWINRVDVLVSLRRKATRIYAVRNLLAADIHLFDDTHVDETITVPPAP